MRWLFIAPRFHTNQADLVAELCARGDHVDFLVWRQGHSESYTTLRPTVVRNGWMGRLACWFARVDRHPDRLALFGIPDIAALYRQVVAKAAPDVAVLRGLTPLTMLAGLLLIASGSRVVFYTQGPLFRPAIPARLRLVAALVFDVLGWGWMTPVHHRGSHAVGRKVDPRIAFVPFARNVSPLARRREPQRPLRLLCIGKFNRRKNLEAALLAVGAVEGAVLTVVGECLSPAQRAYLREMEELARRLPDGRAIIRTNVPHGEMDQVYATHDILIMPSYDEPASCSQLEAMSHGMPVICNRDNGTASYVVDGQCGFHVGGGHREVALAIASYLDNPEQLAAHSAAALAVVRQNHSPRTVCATMAAI